MKRGPAAAGHVPVRQGSDPIVCGGQAALGCSPLPTLHTSCPAICLCCAVVLLAWTSWSLGGKRCNSHAGDHSSSSHSSCQPFLYTKLIWPLKHVPRSSLLSNGTLCNQNNFPHFHGLTHCIHSIFAFIHLFIHSTTIYWTPLHSRHNTQTALYLILKPFEPRGLF